MSSPFEHYVLKLTPQGRAHLRRARKEIDELSEEELSNSPHHEFEWIIEETLGTPAWYKPARQILRDDLERFREFIAKAEAPTVRVSSAGSRPATSVGVRRSGSFLARPSLAPPRTPLAPIGPPPGFTSLTSSATSAGTPRTGSVS